MQNGLTSDIRGENNHPELVYYLSSLLQDHCIVEINRLVSSDPFPLATAERFET